MQHISLIHTDLREPVPTDLSKEKTETGIAIIKGNGV